MTRFGRYLLPYWKQEVLVLCLLIAGTLTSLSAATMPGTLAMFGVDYLYNWVSDLSLAVKALLVTVAAALGAWICERERTAEETGGSVRELRHARRTFEVFIHDKLGALRPIGWCFPELVTEDISGDEMSTELSNRRGALVLVLKPRSCQACLVAQLKGLQHVLAALDDSSAMALYAFGLAPG